MNELENIPKRIVKLPKDRRGHFVPWFIAWVNGEPDFRIIDAEKISEAVHARLCWICSEKLGRHLAFVLGPMCTINRISAEPPSHRECAEFALKHCPFLTNPDQKRNPRAKPEGATEPAGYMIPRNPGVSVLWITRSYSLVRAQNGVLFEVGEPVELSWWAEGRKATRQEIMASIRSGFPILHQMAEQEGPKAVKTLQAQLARAHTLLPSE